MFSSYDCTSKLIQNLSHTGNCWLFNKEEMNHQAEQVKLK